MLNIEHPNTRNMTREERERTAYLAGDFVLSDMILAALDAEDEAAGLQSEINDLPTQDEVVEMRARIEKLENEEKDLHWRLADLEASLDRLDE